MTPNNGKMPCDPDAQICVRYVNGEVTPARSAKWWANWNLTDDAFAIAAWEHSGATQSSDGSTWNAKSGGY